MQVTDRRYHTAAGLQAAVPSCLQALPIFLDRLVSPVTAIVLSVTVVLVFGELGSAHCFLRHNLLMHPHNSHCAGCLAA